MTTSPITGFSLAKAPLNSTFTIINVPTDPVVAHRMMTLGWRPGAQVRVMKKASGGAKIIDLNGSRVAVSGALARTLCVEAVA
ncbi:MAG: ferrous iron transport protein A [Propionibacteriaceae bacterium]|jgi:Fe2+ transport system protein FeoA|nr:ferrous iron transport protein A [Propionibacteriaceae bacterium]